MTDEEIPLGIDGRTPGAVIGLMVLAAGAITLVGHPLFAPAAAAGVGIALGGGLLWGHLRLRRDISRLFACWEDEIEEVRLEEGGFVPRWTVQLPDQTVALTGTAFGPTNPLFLEDDDGLKRL